MLLKNNQAFFRLWVGSLFASLGNIFFEVVVVWYLVVATGSALVAAGIPIAAMMGGILSSALITNRIDQIPTKKLMLFSLGTRCLLLVILLIFQETITRSPLGLFIYSFILAILSLIWFLARAKSIPEVVTQDELVKANGLEGVSAGIVRIAAWGLGGFFITRFDLNTSILFTLAAALIATYFLMIARWRPVLGEKDPKSQGLLEGLNIMNQEPTVKRIIYSEVLFYFFMGFLWVAFPIKVDALGDGLLYGYQGMAFGIGYLITSLMIAKRGSSKIKTFYLAGLAFYMIGNIFMSIALTGWVLLSGLLISGLATSYWITGRQTLIHTNIPTHEVGKVFSLFELGAGLVQIPGFLLGGLLVDHFGFTWLMILISLLQFSCFIWLRRIK